MKSFGAVPIGAFFLAMTASIPLPASINFDDIDASLGDVPLDSLSPYQGLNWGNFSAYTSVPGFPGYNNGIVSSPNAAYTAGDAFGAPIVSVITRTSGFGLSVTLTGLYGGSRSSLKP